MTDEEKWLSENSPYSYHKSRKSQFAMNDCCGCQPLPEGSQIYHHNPVTDGMAWFTLHQCPVCGRYYIGLAGKWKRIENPLQYRRREDCNFSGAMLPLEEKEAQQ